MLDGDRPSQRPIHGQRDTPCLHDLHCVDYVPCLQRNHGKDILLMKTITVKLYADDRAILSQKIQNYLSAYPRLGYDTRLSGDIEYDYNKEQWVAVINRLNSCD